MIPPVDSAFTQGSLMLPSSPAPISEMTSAGSPVCDAATLISLLVIICILRRIIEIFPSLLASLIRWKESINLSNSVRLSRDRSLIALTMIVPFCLVVTKSGIYSPSFMETMSSDARFGIIMGVFSLYMGLRLLLERFCAPKRRNIQMYRCACRSSYTFFILLTILLLSFWGVFSVLGTDQSASKDAMLWISGGIYLIFILRKTQIFASSCSLFTAFLYLCALEILPTGALVASAVIL
jgi:hypothetical protein